jgi:hypothetical protein
MSKFTRMLKMNVVQLILGFIVIGGLVWYIPKCMGERNPKTAVWAWELDTAKVHTIKYKPILGEPWELIRNSKGWMATNGSISFEPPQSAINELLSGLCSWQPDGYSPALPEDWPKYGLTGASEQLVFDMGHLGKKTLQMGKVTLPDGEKQYYARSDKSNDVLIGAPDAMWLANPLQLVYNTPLCPVPTNTLNNVAWQQDAKILYLWQKRMGNAWETNPDFTIDIPLFEALLGRIDQAKHNFTISKSELPTTTPSLTLQLGSSKKTHALFCWMAEDSSGYLMQTQTWPSFVFEVSNTTFDSLFGQWPKTLIPNQKIQQASLGKSQ